MKIDQHEDDESIEIMKANKYNYYTFMNSMKNKYITADNIFTCGFKYHLQGIHYIGIPVYPNTDSDTD